MASVLGSWIGNVRTSAFVAVTLVGCNPVFGIHEGQPRPLCVDPSGLLIDDMEDGDSTICALGGRSGAWFDFGDGTTGAELTPMSTQFQPTLIGDGSRGTSQYAAHFSGSGFKNWGAYMGLSLTPTYLPYDANILGGIKFWMKSDTPVTIEFPTSETTPTVGECVDSASENNCNNHFAFKVSAPAPGWFEYEVPFKALVQRPGGSAAWNPRHLLNIQFGVPAGAAFDVWVDDIAFYRCPGPECQPTCTDPARPVSCRASGGPHASCQPAGTDCAVVATWCADPLLIDDMEDGDKTICASGGRFGTWFAVGDGTSANLQPAPAVFKPTEIPGGRGPSRYAAHLAGSGFTGWGAEMGSDLHGLKGKRLTYDPGDARGVRFWMKSNAPVAISFPIPETTKMDQYGGTCANDRNCNNPFYFRVGPSGGDWQEYLVPFASLRQGYHWDANGNLIGGSATWSPSLMTSIAFGTSGDFDIWVDDIRFDPCSSSDCVPTCPAGISIACPASGAQPADCWPVGTDCATIASFVQNTGVWGSGRNDVWVVGVSTTTFAGMIRHWDGYRLTTVDGLQVPPIWGVWGSGADDVWAVADNGTVARKTGSSWSAAASGTSAQLVGGVWGSATNDVWAVAYPGHLRHWDGGWSDASLSPSDLVWDVWGTGGADVWAVGANGTTFHHGDGSAWTPYPTGISQYLDAVWGSDARNFWAVGDGGAITHWDGSAWSEQTSGTSLRLSAIWGSGPNDVWAVGAQGTIIHGDGTANGWSASVSGTTYNLYAVWGNAADDVWAVGSGVILHWDGFGWSPRT